MKNLPYKIVGEGDLKVLLVTLANCMDMMMRVYKVWTGCMLSTLFIDSVTAFVNISLLLLSWPFIQKG